MFILIQVLWVFRQKLSSEIGGSFISSKVAFQDQSTGITERTDNPLGTPFMLTLVIK